MSLRCFFGHQFSGIAVSHYNDTSYAPDGQPGAKSTHLTSRCSRCGKFRRDSLYGAGHLPLEAFLLTAPVSKERLKASSRATDAAILKAMGRL